MIWPAGSGDILTGRFSVMGVFGNQERSKIVSAAFGMFCVNEYGGSPL